MSSRTFHTNSEEETIELGRSLAGELSGVVLLIGNLGAGKTTLTKGIAEGRGAARAENVSSPTFTLVHQYGDIRHIDLYRLDTQQEVETLGLREMFDSAPLVLLEWAERFPELLPRERTEIRLRTLPGTGDNETREITISTSPL